MHTREPQPVPSPGESALRRRIVEAARAQFFANGIRAVTMADLAGELGISKKTLYARFASKGVLLETVILEKVRSIDTDLERITSDDSLDFFGALARLLASMQRQLDELRPPFLRDIQRTAPDMFALVERRRKEVIRRHFRTLLDKGRQAGIVRMDVPVQLVIELLLGATHAIMNPRTLAELGLAPKDGFSAILTVTLEGVLTERKASP